MYKFKLTWTDARDLINSSSCAERAGDAFFCLPMFCAVACASFSFPLNRDDVLALCARVMCSRYVNYRVCFFNDETSCG
jgi:hypothetical protein